MTKITLCSLFPFSGTPCSPEPRFIFCLVFCACVHLHASVRVFVGGGKGMHMKAKYSCVQLLNSARWLLSSVHVTHSTDLLHQQSLNATIKHTQWAGMVRLRNTAGIRSMSSPSLIYGLSLTHTSDAKGYIHQTKLLEQADRWSQIIFTLLTLKSIAALDIKYFLFPPRICMHLL